MVGARPMLCAARIPCVVALMFSSFSSCDLVDPFHENKDIGTLPPGCSFSVLSQVAAHRVLSCRAGGQGGDGFWEAEADPRDSRH